MLNNYTVCPKHTAVLLCILYHFKAHTVWSAEFCKGLGAKAFPLLWTKKSSRESFEAGAPEQVEGM